MEVTVTYHAQKTADTEPVIFRMELVLDVKLDIKEQFVQQVFLVRFFIYENPLSILLSLLCRIISGSVFAIKIILKC